MTGAARFSYLLVILVGCTSEKVELLLDLKTDLVPGVEVGSIVTERFDHLPRTEEEAGPSDRRERRAMRGERWDGPIRIAELSDLEPGRHYVRVRLMTRGDEPVLQRLGVFTVRETSIFTITMTRDCRGVMCPVEGDDPTATACVGGRCADERCTEETPEHCPPPLCTSDAECEPFAACASGRCSSGVCLAIADDASCATHEWCSPDDGCTPETRVLEGSPGGIVLPYELVVAPDGDVTVIGAVGGAVDLGEGPLPAPPARGMMIAGYTSALAPIWGRVYAASDVTEGRALALSLDGGTLATGYFLGDVTFGTTMVSGGVGQETMVLSHDPAGMLAGVEVYPTGRENAQGRGLVVGSDGAVAIAGVYGVDVTIGGVTLPSVPDAATDWAYFAVVDPLSTARWAVHASGTVSVLGDDVAFLPSGSVCAVGRFDADVTVEGDTRIGAGGFDGFVVRYDATGAALWLRTFGGPGQDAPYSVAALGDACLVVGQLDEGAVFDDVVPETRGGADGFVARYDASGAVEWVRVIGGPGIDFLWPGSLGPSGTIVVGGAFSDAIEAAGEALTASGRDGLVAGVSGDGTVVWARAIGGEGDETVSSVGYDFGSNRVAVAVRFTGATEVGRHATTSVGMQDAFLHWFLP